MQEIKTVCRGCIFAAKNEKTQYGCLAGQLVKLVESGGKLLEAYDEENNEFYIIDGQFCVWKRTEKWAERHLDENLFDVVLEEMKLPYQLIIVANESIEDLRTTINSIMEQELLPKHITVIKKQESKIDHKEIIKLLQKNCSIPWNNKVILGDGGVFDAVDDIINSKPFPYYGIFNAGCNIPKQLFKDLNTKVTSEGFRFAIIKPNKNNDGYIASTSIHLHYLGNVGITLEEKLRDNKTCQNMIFQINSLFDYFPK